jgi:hypothetical protein
LDEEDPLESQSIDGKTKCRNILPNWMIKKNCHATARHKCDWRKKTGGCMAREMGETVRVRGRRRRKMRRKTMKMEEKKEGEEKKKIQRRMRRRRRKKGRKRKGK